MSKKEKKALKILYFTHNSLGIGHAVRTLAVIRGLRKINNDVKFLVVTASKVPNLFLDEGIEVIKLPSTIFVKDKNGWVLKPRFLDIGISNIIGMRYKILLDCFYSFRPHVVFIDNILSGQGSELLPIILHRHIEKATGQHSFLLYLISRGISGMPERILVDNNKTAHLSKDINSLEIVDRIFIMENRRMLDSDNNHLIGLKKDKLQYLGKIVTKTKQELSRRKDVFLKNSIPLNKKVILIRLGHEKKEVDLLEKIILSFQEVNKEYNEDYFLLICSEPYTNKNKVEQIIAKFGDKNINHQVYISDMIDIIYYSEIVISRAGYNIVAEILATETKAILIPFEERTKEQPMRAKRIKNKGILYLSEQGITKEKIIKDMRLLISKDSHKNFNSDRDKISKIIYSTLLKDLRKYRIEEYEEKI